MNESTENTLAEVIKQRRISRALTLRELAVKSGVSASHLGRIERGERFPSARILLKIAGPLAFRENELFTLARYLSPQSPMIAEMGPPYGGDERLDPYVAGVLAQEPLEVQRSVIVILTILKGIAKGISKKGG